MKGLNFVAVDIETAVGFYNICEIGIAEVKDSQIVDSCSWLIQPYNNYIDSFNTKIHKITPEMTKDCPSFEEIWPEIRKYFEGQIVVAHNSQFDMKRIVEELSDNEIDYPNCKFFCTRRIAEYAVSGVYDFKLPTLCERFNIELARHHRAEDDARAAAEIFINEVNYTEVESLEELQEKYHFNCGKILPDVGYVAQKRYYKSSGSSKRGYGCKPKASNIIGDPSKIDEGHYFYGKNVCFTGKFSFGTREECFQIIADIGGTPCDNVSKKTDVLVVGEQNYKLVGEDRMSTKQEKAMKLRDEGQIIEILSESDFMDLAETSIVQKANVKLPKKSLKQNDNDAFTVHVEIKDFEKIASLIATLEDGSDWVDDEDLENDVLIEE